MQAQVCAHVLDASSVKKALQGSLVYKDQCIKCFHDPRDEKGLDICLKCFGGFCVEGEDHGYQHYQQTKHAIYLNFKLVEKLRNESDRQEELTKLAIGIPGGANLDTEEYDEIFQLRCRACDLYLDNKILEDLVREVERENSAFKKNDICQWELEIMPCEHTLTLNQYSKDLSMGLSHCHECSLNSNLWLCLVCGNVGCGRKNFDGTGGNNHAINHSKSHQHCLVVKLGTITQEGNASIYCYDCDNDVSDVNLQAHLQAFGIDVSSQKKTDKSVSEMNLEMNKNLTLSSILEEGKQLNPVFGARRTGLLNIGNSCYINSVLQVLFALPEFEQKFTEIYGKNHLNTCQKQTVNCLTCQLSKLAIGLTSGEYSLKKLVKIIGTQTEDLSEYQKYVQEGIAINDLRTLIGKNHPEFKTKQMQDALEYLEHFLDLLEKEEKGVKDKQPLGNLFQHKIVNKLVCFGCGGVKLIEVSTNEFKLPVSRPTSEQFQSHESIIQDSENKHLEEPEYKASFNESIQTLKQGDLVELSCSGCKEKSEFKSQTFFKSFPKYLLVPTNRLVLDNWVPKKLNAKIDIPEQFDFSELKYNGLKSSEKLLDEENKKVDLVNQNQIDEISLLQLLEMGFGENRSRRALDKFYNNLESAMNFLFENMDDLSLDLPFQPAQLLKSTNEGEVNQESLQILLSMGFNNVQCQRALIKYKNNVEMALDGLSSGVYFDEEVTQKNNQMEEEQQLEDVESGNSKYQLIAAIVHLGKSTHAGHYVAYVKRDNQWIYYNDSKVATSVDPSLGKGYIYLFKQM